MFFLRPDVAADLVHAGLAHRDGEIAGLPLETPSDLLVLIDPAGGIRFDEADRLRDGKICLELHQQVDMVRYAADLQQDTPLTAENSSNVVVESLFEVLVDQGDAFLGGKDNVVDVIGVGTGNGSIWGVVRRIFYRPLHGLTNPPGPVDGLTPVALC